MDQNHDEAPHVETPYVGPLNASGIESSIPENYFTISITMRAPRRWAVSESNFFAALDHFALFRTESRHHSSALMFAPVITVSG